MHWRKFFFVALAMSIGCGSVSAAAAGKMLHVDGLKAELDNGNLKASFTETGTLAALVVDGVDLVRDRAPGKTTFYLDYNIKRHAYPVVPEQLKVIEDSKDTAHIAYIDTTSQLAVEYHFLMKRKEHGLYSYVIARNNTGKVLNVSELRTVYRLDRTIFDHAYNGVRQGLIPRQDEMKKGKKLQDETYDMGATGQKYTNGPIYSKYDYAAYMKDTPVWGAYGHDYGFWVMPVSTEYLSGGPLKQDLTVHYDTIVCNYLTSAHFGTGDFEAPADWQKLYGPWYLYVNKGTEQKVIPDAEKQARQQQKKWPFKWMNEALYPVNRGSVTGQLQLNGQPAGGAQIILARPGADIVHEKASYIFAATTDRDGRFRVEKVRPGMYELTAYMQGGANTDTFVSRPFMVESTGKDLKKVDWQRQSARVLWQIGTADHSAAEFVYGRELRNYSWQTKVPADLDFQVGRDDPVKDWYYAQTKEGSWNIHFDLAQSTAHEHQLVMALAGFSTGMGKKYKDVYAEVCVNGKTVKKIVCPNDQTVYRSAVGSGTYHREVIALAPEALKAGHNVITIKDHGASLMYDTILLEEK